MDSCNGLVDHINYGNIFLIRHYGGALKLTVRGNCGQNGEMLEKALEHNEDPILLIIFQFGNRISC